MKKFTDAAMGTRAIIRSRPPRLETIDAYNADGFSNLWGVFFRWEDVLKVIVYG